MRSILPINMLSRCFVIARAICGRALTLGDIERIFRSGGIGLVTWYFETLTIRRRLPTTYCPAELEDDPVALGHLWPRRQPALQKYFCFSRATP